MKKVFYMDYFMLGILLTALALMINQQNPITLSIASILTPTGAKVLVAGFHIKHWMVGVLILLPSILFIKKSPQFASLFSAIGITLILDEVDDISKFISTGEI